MIRLVQETIAARGFHVLLCFLFGLGAHAGPALTLTNIESPTELACPIVVHVPLDDSLATAKGLVLRQAGTEKVLPAQLLFPLSDTASQSAAVAAILPPGSKSGTRYEIGTTDAPASAFRVEDDGNGALAMFEGGELVLRYLYGIQQPPPEATPDRARSSYISPVMGLDGEQLTEDFPKDHYHHRALFWAWPTFSVGGATHDHYHIDGIWTRFERWLDQQAGAACARIGVQNGWYRPDRKVGSEVVELTVWRAGEIGRAIDISLTWTAHEPLALSGRPEVGYGGFSIRFPDRQNSVVSFPDGPQENSDMKESPWGDLSAVFPGGRAKSGISILVGPDNPDAEPGWTIRGGDTYGFLGASWPGTEIHNFEPGKPVTARHRIWVHRGDVDAGKVGEAFSLYKTMPKLVP